MVRLYRRFAIGCGVVAGWAVLVALGWAVLGTPASVSPGADRWAGPAVMLVCALLVGSLALFFADVVCRLRRRSAPGHSLLLGVDPAGVLVPGGPGGRRISYREIAAVAVAWHPIGAPAFGVSRRLGQQLGSRLTRRAGLDGVVRRVDLTTTAGELVPVVVGPWATDAEFGRVLEAMRFELARHGRPAPSSVPAP